LELAAGGGKVAAGFELGSDMKAPDKGKQNLSAEDAEEREKNQEKQKGPPVGRAFFLTFYFQCSKSDGVIPSRLHKLYR
jgi:hypothetical protein